MTGYKSPPRNRTTKITKAPKMESRRPQEAPPAPPAATWVKDTTQWTRPAYAVKYGPCQKVWDNRGRRVSIGHEQAKRRAEARVYGRYGKQLDKGE